MSFLGPGGSSSHHRSKSPARSIVGNRAGEGAFVRDKSPARPHAHRSRSEPEGFFTRKRSRSRSRSPPGGIAGFLGVGGGSSSKHQRSRSPGGLGGFFGGNSHGHSNSRSRARSPGGLGSIFGGGGDRRDHSPQSDIRSFFGGGGGGKHYSGTSRYGRRPRDGFLQKIWTMIRRTFRDLKRYAKNNPVKMVTLVLMPLLTSGILVKLLGSLGIRLPSSIASLAGGGGAKSGGGQGGGYYGSGGYGGAGGHQGGGGGGGGGGSGIGIGEVLSVAKMFM